MLEITEVKCAIRSLGNSRSFRRIGRSGWVSSLCMVDRMVLCRSHNSSPLGLDNVLVIGRFNGIVITPHVYYLPWVEKQFEDSCSISYQEDDSKYCETEQ